LLGHDDLLRWNNRRAASFTARGCDDARETAYTLSGREGARGGNHFAPAVAARHVHSWPRPAAPSAHRPRDPAFDDAVHCTKLCHAPWLLSATGLIAQPTQRRRVMSVADWR